MAKGTELRPSDKQYVLSAYVHRYTMEHKPSWADKPCEGNGKRYAPQYATDAEWLANTEFKTRKNGRLDHRTRHCQSSGQTWPLGMWLD
jgi:hypothetical protein